MNKSIYELEWGTLLSFGIAKGVSGAGINNGEVRGKSFAGDLVEETEVNIEASASIKVVCRNIWMTG